MDLPLLRALVLVSTLLFASGEARAVVFLLNSNGDASDASAGDGVCDTGGLIGAEPECTLRAIIEESNALSGSDNGRASATIATDANGFVQIAPTSPLPVVTDTLLIDLLGAPGYDAADPFATPIVQLSGSQAGFANGIELGPTANGSLIRAIAVHGFQNRGLLLDADGATVQACHVGIADGQQAAGNGSSGIAVNGNDALIGQRFNIGTGWSRKGNVVSSNGATGVLISGDDALVAGNRIGTDRSGTVAMGNASAGVSVFGDRAAVGFVGTLITGTELASGNLISGNLYGVDVGETAVDTTIEANFIGTDATGTLEHGNLVTGVRVTASDTRIGAIGVGSNLISGNGVDGILALGNPSIAGIVVEGNRIGVTADESAALPNGRNGVFSFNAVSSVEGNVIGGNAASGIRSEFLQLLAFNNHIGTNSNGDDLGNGAHGIISLSSPSLIVRGLSGEENVIGFNTGSGLFVSGCATCLIADNTIGSASPGDGAGNGAHGIYIADGVLAQVLDNTIGENGSNGISLAGGSTSTGHPFRTNRIFGNTGIGIDLGNDGPTPNDVGDGDVGENNLQNFPVFDPDFTLYNASLDQIEVRYRVDSNLGDASYPLRVDFYLADADLEEGAVPVGTDFYPAVSAGAFRSFAFRPPPGFAYESEWLLATARDANDNTSEFGAPVPLPEPSDPLGLAAGAAFVALLSLRARRPVA